MTSARLHSAVIAAALAVLLLTGAPLAAQQHGASDLIALVSGVTTTARVLVIGMHPDDEDSQLLAYLARGHQVHAAYLSITRGESAGNFLGPASGTTLGAARTQETLAARRIDGAEQYFTPVYDFGFARSDSELFVRWNRDSLLGDVVKVIRSFRPHVIVANTVDTTDHDVQHRALATLVRDAFEAAADGKRYHALDFGDPWEPAKLYARGTGLSIDASAYDPVLGATYAEVARQARAEYRSQGLLGITTIPPRVELKRIAARGRLASDTASERSLFDGVDTTLARLGAGIPLNITADLRSVAALADSARRAFDATRPGSAVEYLARLSTLLAQIRRPAPACRHPGRVQPIQSPHAFTCDQALLDLDAALDLMLERADAALLGAAGVTIEAAADRELVASSDTAPVVIRVANRGAHAVAVRSISAWGDVDTATAAADVPPGSAVSVTRRITQLSQRYQWWMGTRVSNRYTVPPSSIDGITREPRMRARNDTGRADPSAMRANGAFSIMATTVAIPENIRRISDVTVTLDVGGASVTTSVGPVVYPYADPVVGLQMRPIAGVADVTLNLNRALSFVPAGKTIDRGVHVNITSYTRDWKSLTLRVVSPPGVTDSLSPKGFRFAPREQRDLVVQLRGAMAAGEKQPFGIVGSISGQAPFSSGFRTTQYPQLLPIRVSWQSGMWLQPVEITVPKTLVVVYVAGVSDDVPMALQDVGVSVANIPPADLLSVDLKRVTTVVFGPRAFEAHPELLLQMPRFMSWARNGGTIVVQRGGPETLRSGALPHFVDLGTPPTQRVSDPASPVTRVAAAPTLLQWPNIIGPDDWKDWVGERAPYTPTQVDPKYEHVIETHNAGDKSNPNALIVARVGKGLFIYSALTLDEQIAAGVPGALRLMVNLLSAGITPPGAR